MKKSCTVQRIRILSDNHPMKLLLLHPQAHRQSREKTPGILWIHGGGYTTGMAAMVLVSRARWLAAKYGAVVVSPEYRLAGRAPYPAALNDCYAALRYMKEHAAELGFSDRLIMVGGESAGGGLAAALCMLARDRGEIRIVYQMPLYPMLDHRDTASSRNNHGITWDTRRNHAAWKKYLRGLSGDIPPYASPARQTDYSGLPPAYTFIGSREAFYCETLQYIDHLRQAGVPAGADVYPTGFHAFDMLLPFRRISRQAIRAFEKEYLSTLERLLGEEAQQPGEPNEQASRRKQG